MPDFRVRVRYHEIEVEVSIPQKDRETLGHTSGTGMTAIEIVKQATKQVEQLITAGRRSVQP